MKKLLAIGAVLTASLLFAGCAPTPETDTRVEHRGSVQGRWPLPLNSRRCFHSRLRQAPPAWLPCDLVELCDSGGSLTAYASTHCVDVVFHTHVSHGRASRALANQEQELQAPLNGEWGLFRALTRI